MRLGNRDIRGEPGAGRDVTRMEEGREVCTTTVRIDKDTKQEATQVFKCLGLSFSSGIEVYLKKVAREQAIPFDLSLNTRQ